MSSVARRLVSGCVTYARHLTGSHLHGIEGYSILAETTRAGDVFRSVPFRVGGHKSELLLYPNGFDADHRGFVSANLRRVGWSYCETMAMHMYRISVLSFAGNPAHSCTVGPWHHFRGICSDTKDPTMKTGVYELVAVEELLRSAPFLLRNHCLNVICDVSVLKTDSTPLNRWFML